MVSHHPAKFGGHRHCVCGDVMLVLVEGQYSTYFRLNPSLLFVSKAHGMPCSQTRNSRRRRNNLPVCPMKDSRSWSHMSTRIADGTYCKNFFQSV